MPRWRKDARHSVRLHMKGCIPMNVIQLPSPDDDETKPELKAQPDRKDPNRGSGGSKDPKKKYQHRFSY